MHHLSCFSSVDLLVVRQASNIRKSCCVFSADYYLIDLFSSLRIRLNAF